jgi:hypothetical protein
MATTLLGEIHAATSSGSPSPGSLSRTSSDDFDDHKLPANAAKKPVGDGGVGGEHAEKRLQEEQRLASIPVRLEKIRGPGREKYRLLIDDELRRLMVDGSLRLSEGKETKRKTKFGDVGFVLLDRPRMRILTIVPI